ncbi:unnamed protein product [Paramecium octaurelia]|uniref:Uncharacterized protein n=1 Tax=Paramecium octaurelia TaxID=43137 RepID=A0A8S1TZA9_PAROT|nr:unnamed protein product [Paramecium octaurelia]
MASSVHTGDIYAELRKAEKNIFLIKNTLVFKDFMKPTYVYSNPVLSLLSSNSTQSSPMTTSELNDSIEYYMDQKDYQTEVEIVKYLHGLGVQTKTDPLIKEQQYWKERKQKSQIMSESIINSSERLVLNPTVNRLMRKNVIQIPRNSNSPYFLLDQL